MKYLLVVLVAVTAVWVSIPTDIIAQPAPFDKPFTLSFRMAFQVDSAYTMTIYDHYGRLTSSSTNDTVIAMLFTDTMSATSASERSGDTVRYLPSSSTERPGAIQIVYNSIAHTALLTISQGPWMVRFRNLTYDESGIYFNDSVLAEHLDTASYNYYYITGMPGKLEYETRVSLRKVASVDLGGIVQPVHLESGVTFTSNQRSGMTFFRQGDELVCSFEPAISAETLEVYSLLGQRVLALPIATGEEHATMKLPSGLYFVRLGNKVVKVQNN